MPFKSLEDLNFAYNNVRVESSLLAAIDQNPKLKLIIVTGNPFAQLGQLKLLQEHWGGEVRNENNYEQPQYLKGMRQPDSDKLFQNMSNYAQATHLVSI